jgi:hypothetical protein
MLKEVATEWACTTANRLKTTIPIQDQCNALRKHKHNSDMRSWFELLCKREANSPCGALVFKDPKPLSKGR